VIVLAAGKAAAGMARGALGVAARGLVVAPTGVDDLPAEYECVVGGHPSPNAGSEEGGRKALALAESLSADDTLLVLLSGGASALMAVPADGIALDEKRTTSDRLMREGADIHALNTVRKHLSQIKGGWLAARTHARTVALAISDVVGDDPSVIASGPTVADATTFADALEKLRQFGGESAYPASVIARLKAGASGKLPDTPKPGDPRLARATTTVIGSRRDAMRGAADEARRRGYHVLQIDEAIVGESREAADAFVRDAVARTAETRRPAAVIASGETTVHVKGKGKGGRNQEFALAAAAALAPATVVAASIGTDGVDGPTDAAGAIADATTLDRARAAGLDPRRFLDDNNAYAFFDALGDLIHTGPTGTNVGDLQLFLLA
jgi:hydroxypyruvate reductase